MRAIALAVVMLVWPALAAAAAPVASLPYRIAYGGWFTVSAMVNGEGPFDFIIDTGATDTLVFENLALRQNMQPTGGPLRTVFGLSQGREFPPYLAGDIVLSEAIRLDDHETVVLGDWVVDRDSPQGVLGLDLLARYTLFFDAEEGMLHFYPPDAEIDYPAEWRAVALSGHTFGQTPRPLYLLEATVANVKTRFLLDLGASGTVVNSYAYRRMIQRRWPVINLDAEAARTRSQVIDAFDEEETAFAVRARGFRAGRARWSTVILIVHDAPIFEEMGVQSEPFGLFGADMVANRGFAVDFRRRRMMIGPEIR
ncbi:aspartyl protease family protein [Amphiplicatus metriothermophilus]|uniref:Aspartyl protease n=1 Tax=Amphiplicatus metriothermophilus TaxID=1519374 RepID=A0A239PJ93_9PROT|nr:aspartyl protease family protein [Amphiplicatus metriothermophilus]MBB5517794.1 hypothetical protein [Amphiplicatus metriothermophilus]SNT67872.1 Aspartyl protease [Amphiplicatus metriothermophilus]